MTNLTEVSSYDANISVPDDGEEITAVAAGAGRGPIRPSLQSLANRAKYLRDRIAAVLNGTLSVKSLVIDGTGGQTVSPASGTLVLTVDSAGVAVPGGVCYADGMVIAKGVVKSSGTDFWGYPYNLASVTNAAAGQYVITTRTCPLRFAGLVDDATVHVPVSCQGHKNLGVFSPLNFAVETVKKTVAGVAVLQTSVRVWASDGTPTDSIFSITIG